MSVLHARMYVRHMWAWCLRGWKKAWDSPGTGTTDGCKPSYGCWDISPGLWESNRCSYPLASSPSFFWALQQFKKMSTLLDFFGIWQNRFLNGVLAACVISRTTQVDTHTPNFMVSLNFITELSHGRRNYMKQLKNVYWVPLKCRAM